MAGLPLITIITFSDQFCNSAVSSWLTDIRQMTSLYLLQTDWTMKGKTVFTGFPSFASPTKLPLLYSIHWAV